MPGKHLRITLIGSGNVATQMGLALRKAGYLMEEVYSRNAGSARALALKLRAKPVSSLHELSGNADLFILAVKDDAVAPLIKKLALTNKAQWENKLIVHTSGSLPIAVLGAVSADYGVLYPVQTLSKNKAVDFSRVPLCIEGNSKRTEKKLWVLAQSVSGNVQSLSSDQRRILHLAAIFASNFSNHMYTLAEKLLRKNKMSFDLILPLIRETAEKVKSGSPSLMQTGPAIRKDKEIMKTHLKMLGKDKQMQKLYSLISQSILTNHVKPALKH